MKKRGRLGPGYATRPKLPSLFSRRFLLLLILLTERLGRASFLIIILNHLVLRFTSICGFKTVVRVCPIRRKLYVEINRRTRDGWRERRSTHFSNQRRRQRPTIVHRHEICRRFSTKTEEDKFYYCIGRKIPSTIHIVAILRASLSYSDVSRCTC